MYVSCQCSHSCFHLPGAATMTMDYEMTGEKTCTCGRRRVHDDLSHVWLRNHLRTYFTLVHTRVNLTFDLHFKPPLRCADDIFPLTSRHRHSCLADAQVKQMKRLQTITQNHFIKHKLLRASHIRYHDGRYLVTIFIQGSLQWHVASTIFPQVQSWQK